MEHVNCVFQCLGDVFPAAENVATQGGDLLSYWDIVRVDRIIQGFNEGFARISTSQINPAVSSSHYIKTLTLSVVCFSSL